ncbi:MAG: tRNA-intron lyase [Candidatus Micrarchaeia archaeon]
MGLEITIDRKAGIAYSAQPQAVTACSKGFFGEISRGTVFLAPEEALYLCEARNALPLAKDGRKLGMEDVVSAFSSKRLIPRYYAYKDWKDRGLVARDPMEMSPPYKSEGSARQYARGKFRPGRLKLSGHFLPGSLTTVCGDGKDGMAAYGRHWLGQYGTYKAHTRGKLLKLDIFETVFLAKKKMLKIANSTAAKARRAALGAHPDFDRLYEVFEEWRQSGYVVKTGFKFGTHFRLYFPGASPVSENGAWVHSKHVIQVFPRDCRMLVSEWARAIRLAHSVNKTFILAIPGKKARRKKSLFTPDFLLYHRAGPAAQNPKTSEPKYLMMAISEEEKIGGELLSEALDTCRRAGLGLAIAIVDRETSVTYYFVKRVSLPKSRFEYYEIEWGQP